jgi:hypothetical protein
MLDHFKKILRKGMYNLHCITKEYQRSLAFLTFPI